VVFLSIACRITARLKLAEEVKILV